MPDTEKPVIDASQVFTYLPDQSENFVIGRIAASDDTDVTQFVEFGGDPYGYFLINNNGDITLTAAGAAATAASNNLEVGENAWVLKVRAIDAAGNLSDFVDVDVQLRSLTSDETAAVVFRDLADGLYTAAQVMSIARKPLLPLKHKFKSVDKLQANIAKMEDKLWAANKMSGVLEKWGPLKAVFKVFSLTTEKAAVNLRKAEFKLETVSEKSAEIGALVETIDEGLKLNQRVLGSVGFAADLLSRRLASSEQNLKKASSLIPLPEELDLLLGLAPGNLPAPALQGLEMSTVDPTPQAAGAVTFDLADMPISIDVDAFAARLARMEFQSDQQLGQMAEVAAEFASQLKDIGDKLTAIVDGVVNNDLFKKLSEFSDAVSASLAAIAPIFSPLSAVADALGPVLDAMGSIFGFLLKPLEYILDAVIEATGIKSLISDLADELTELLPDFGFLDTILEQINQIFLIDFPQDLKDQVTEPLQELLDELQGPNFPMGSAIGDQYNNTLTGSLMSTGSLTLNGMAGDDNLFGGDFDDTLIGGAGSDFLSGGGGNDRLDGGDNEKTTILVPSKLNPNVLEEQEVHEPDFVIYEGSRDDYAIVGELNSEGAPTGRWIISDNRTAGQVAASGSGVNNGTDELIDIEIVFWDDSFLDLTQFDTFIETKSVDGDVAFVTPDGSSLPNVPDPTDPDGPGIEVKTGDLANDYVIGDLGIDFIEAGGGNDQINSGTNGILSRQFSVGDVLFGGDGDDVYVAAIDSARYDHIVDIGGNDTLDLSAHRGAQTGVDGSGNPTYEDTPLTVFLGSTDREEFYRPISINVDIDSIGRAVNPNVGLISFHGFNAGVVRGIDNIIGTRFDDIFYGTDGVNVLNGKDGNDQLRGLAGDDVLLGGAGHDILIGDGGNDYLDGGSGSNVYIGGLGDDTIVDLASTFSTVKYSAVAQTDHYNQSVDFVDFLDTGFGTYDFLDMPDSIIVFNGDIGNDQLVAKYEETSGEPNLFGIDTISSIERIVGSTGDDIIYSALGSSQTIWSNGGDDILLSTGGDTQNSFYAGPGDDVFLSDSFSEDLFFGGAGSDTVFIENDTEVQGDSLFGDDNRATPLSGVDVLDFSLSTYSWHLYMNPRAPNGDLVGFDPLSALSVEDPLYIQPTLGVFGTVPKLPGVQIDGEVYEIVPTELRVPDPNTPRPGGRADNIGEFEVVEGSQQRDLLVGGNPDYGIILRGNGGDDVLYAAQRFAAELHGGDGNDVLGTYNDTYGSSTVTNWFDEDKLTVMTGGAGNDTFVAGDFRESFDGGEGYDALTYEVSTAGVRVDLTALTASGGYATGDIILGGIEKVTGSQFDDVLFGDALGNELVGWDGADIIRGYDGADHLFGNDGNDLLYGGDGNDVLHGGNGGDLLDGGAGVDTASFNLFQSHPKGGLNQITNNTDGVMVDLAAADVTGEVTAGADILVNIENIKGSVGNDTVFGDDGENLLAGNHGNDLLEGRGANDVLVGGDGDDTLLGGAGEDFLIGGAGTNVLDGGDGIDAVDYGNLDRGISIIMAGAGSRTAEETGVVDYFTRIDKFVWLDSLPEEFDSNTPWQDLLAIATDEVRYTYQIFDRGTDDPSDDGFRIEDAITPEQIWRLDPLFARSADDLEPVRFLSRGTVVDSDDVTNLDVVKSPQVTIIDDFVEAFDLITSIERIVGSRGDDSILGNAEDTFFYGGLGADTIDGGAGIDTASYEHAGFSALDGEADFQQGVTVDLLNGIFTGSEAEGDALTGIENIIGSSFDDILRGDDADNHLTLGLGNNVASGGAGVDTVALSYASTDLIVQFSTDVLRIVRADGSTILGQDRISSDVEFYQFTDQTLSFAQMLSLAPVGTENNDLLIGTAIDDELNGFGGDDVIEGRDSGDTLIGGDGNDLLKGEGGDDTLFGGAGEDRYIGGTGDDAYYVDDAGEDVIEAMGEGSDTVFSTVDFTLPDHVENLALQAGANGVGTGNALDNFLEGSDTHDVLSGLGGDDRLSGGLGQDTLIGGTGNDRYILRDTQALITEEADSGFDTIVTTVNVTRHDHVEQIVVSGGNSVFVMGDALNNQFHDGIGPLDGTDVAQDGMGNSTFDGGDGEDTLILSYDLASTTFSFDSDGYLVIENGTQKDFARNIEKFDFSDEFRTYEQLLLDAFPPQDVNVFAGDYFVGTTAIDMSADGGGTQFIYAGDTDSGNNDSNEYNYSVPAGGKAEFQGQNLNAQDDADGTVNSISVDFEGGNTTRLSVNSFAKTLQEMKTGDWDFWKVAIFGGDDRITGSYLSDNLVGYEGNDTIFGGLGDKVPFNVVTDNDSSATTIRTPGAVASSPDFFVDDGDDSIDGAGGNDILDGGTGRDIVLGGAGDDVLYGGGGVFADSLFGGEGDDTLTGGEGGDTFVLTLGMGREVVTDFEVGVDSIDFSSLSKAEFDQININNSTPGVTLIQLSDGSQLELMGVMLTDLPLPILSAAGLNGYNGTRIDLGVNVTNLSGVGDVNGDGIADFVVGWEGTATIDPIAYLVYGREDGFGPETVPYLMDLDEGTSFQFGEPTLGRYAVSQAGDFNGDGLDDLLFAGALNSYVIFGQQGGFTQAFELTDIPAGQGVTLGFGIGYGQDENITGGFDLNADGFDDVVIADEAGFGSVRVVYGSAMPGATIAEGDLDGTRGVIMSASDHDFSYTGNSVSSAGDLNGDGIDDLFIGARFKQVTNQNNPAETEWTGGGYVVYGDSGGFGTSVDLGTMTALQGVEIFGNFDTSQGRTGYTVTGGGDVNGDGIHDLGLSRSWVFQDTDATPAASHAAYIIYGDAEDLGADFQMSQIDATDPTFGTVFTFDIPDRATTPYVGEPAFEGNPSYDTIVSYLAFARIEIVGDLNNDRIADVVISTGINERTIFYTYNPDRGVMESDIMSSITSKTYVVYGVEGGFGPEVDLDLLAAGEGYIVETNGSASNSLPQITSVGDVNGDGSADLLLNNRDGQGMLIYAAPFENLPVMGDVLILGTAAEDQTLTADTSRITDRDGIQSGFAYEWLRDGAPVSPGGDGPTFTLSDVDVGARISLRVFFEDGQGTLESVLSTETMAVTNINDLPMALDDASTGDEDTVFKINVLGNDTDDDGDDLVITSVTQGQNGAVTVNADGTINYAPTLEFSGTDGFEYTISDGSGAFSTGQVSLTVLAVNDAPVTVDDMVTLAEDTSGTVEVLGNDSDVDSATFDVATPVGTQVQSQDGKATLTYDGGGVFSVTGNANAFGTDVFTYTVADDEGAAATATLNITLTPEPDAPTPQDDLYFEPEDSVVTFDVLANDTDPDGDPLTLVSVTNGTFSTAQVTVDGLVEVTPQKDFTGLQIMTYTVRDSTGLENTALLEVRYLGLNDAPVGVADMITLDEDVATDLDILANDTDVDDTVLFIETFPTSTAHGALSDLGNGLLRYTPDGNYNGTDVFTYTLRDAAGLTSTATATLTINPVNDAPYVFDDTSTGAEDITQTIDVLDNDRDIDSADFRLVSATDGAFSTATVNGDGTLSITPNADFFGTDTITYTVEDSEGAQAQAEVTVTFTPVNDAPTPQDDLLTGIEGQRYQIDVLANDTDPDSPLADGEFSILSYSQGAFGEVTLADGLLEFGPRNGAIDFFGSDSFTYTVIDNAGLTGTATVTVEISNVNDVPIAVNDRFLAPTNLEAKLDVLANDFDIDNTKEELFISDFTAAEFGSVTLNDDGTFSYVSNPDFLGFDTFSYTISDGSDLFDSTTVLIEVVDNVAPVAVADTVTTAEDTPILFDPLANDTDAEGDMFSLLSISQPSAGGMLTAAGDTGFVYTPGTNANGLALETATYVLEDTFGRQTTGQITFDVTPVDDPTAGDITIVASIASFGTSFYEVDLSGLSDVEGLDLPASDTLDYVNFVNQNATFRVDGVAVDALGFGYFIPRASDGGKALSVDVTITDAAGNMVTKSATYAEPIAEFVPVDPPQFGTPDVIDTFTVNPTLNADGTPRMTLLRGFSLEDKDQIDLSAFSRGDAIRAYMDAELGSAILTFANGNVLAVEGEGVTPETLLLENIILAPGNVAPTGDITITGAARLGETLTADVSGVEDIEQIVAGTEQLQWQRNGEDIVGATQARYTVTQEDVGAALTLIYVFDDGFGTTEEVTSATLIPTAVQGRVILGTNSFDSLRGGDGDDTISGFGESDLIVPLKGDDLVFGGEGDDFLVLEGAQSQYTLSLSPFETILTHRVEDGSGRDTLNSVELLNFTGMQLNLDIFDGPLGLSAGEFGAIIELYIAYFNRAPDALGLYYWGTQYSEGFSLPEMALSFYGQPETQATYASVLNASGQLDTADPDKVDDFVTEVYGNVLGRAPDGPGFDYWTDQLANNPNITPDIFILSLIGGAKNPGSPTAQTAKDQAYLLTKGDLGAYFAVIKGMSDLDDAAAAMALFDGTPDSITATVAAIDDHYADALDPLNGDFLMPLVGVIPDPFEI